MKFSNVFVALAALCAVSTITPMSYKERSEQVANDPYKYSMAINALEQTAREDASLLREQLSNPNQRRNAIGGLLMKAMELGIPKEDMADEILRNLRTIVKLNASDLAQADKLLGLMMFQNPVLR